ncbi:UvrD-helicase domain-containing protein [Fundidesulfovibrio terrae]|uniref:UvrD-helicase domain-containing protein n=1 Tax=Fundidesulfovibrio terrae TaxID=2922866 RepID=UPI001FAFBCAA|nr:UvrD-helicase domain-containing protein [Fundidesulfovibrio terrae]
MIEQLHASAGSGKTYRLTRRFLNLLMLSGSPAPACGPVPGQGYGPESILAITFTNKAAAEMKERVLTSLKSLALGLPDPDFSGRADRDTARAWLERTLKHFQTLNIRTIDSLLNQLARLFALELGLPPDFETSLDEDMVFEALFDAVTAEVPGQEQGLSPLVDRMTDALTLIDGADGFWLAVRVESRLREVFAHLLESGPAAPCDEAALHAEAQVLGSALTASARAVRDGVAACGARPVANFASLLETLCQPLSLKAIPESVYARKAGIDECLTKDSRHHSSPGLEALYQALREDYARARSRGPLIARALSWLPFLEFGSLLMKAFDAYRGDKAVALLSQLPGDVARLLAETGGVSEAFCRLGSRLNHLLIDEFQDTSLSQWAVLSQLAQECLSKAGSLFYVGDVKQAIYGWRGGEAELFRAAAREPELAAICPDPQVDTLSRNWRSAPEIVDFNNRFFSTLESPGTSRLVSETLMPDAPEAVREALGENLRRSFAGAAQELPPGRESSGGFVSVSRLAGDNPADYFDNARAALAELFQKDLLKRRDPSEIAVLTRTNREAAMAAEWLVDLDIPVVTENSLRLADHPVVRGAVSFLAFLDYPPDNMALWGFLSCRELFCRSQGVSMQALSDWLAAQSKGPLYRKFQRDFPDAWQRLIEPFLKGAGPAGPYDLVQELFGSCRVFEAYPDDEVFLRRFLELIHNAETQGFGSLSSFLEFWRDKGREEKIPQPEDSRAVRVLTIHKAKGLEFPVAVAPFHLFPPRRPSGLARMDSPDGTGLTAPMCKELGEVYHRQMAKDFFEQVNLLYVAWTRPEEELHLFLPAHSKLANRFPLARAAELMFQGAGITLDESGATFGRRPPSQAELVSPPPARPEGAEAPEQAAPLSASAPLEWLPGLKIARRELNDPSERLRMNERKRGIVLHKALEILEPGGSVPDAVRRAMAACAAGCGTDADAVALELASGLEWLAAQEFFPQCQHLGLREVELLDADGRVHRPDLLAFTPTQTLVLDYKTGREDPAHHDQLRRYLDLASQLPQAAGQPLRGLIAYVDLQTVREVSYGAAL